MHHLISLRLDFCPRSRTEAHEPMQLLFQGMAEDDIMQVMLLIPQDSNINKQTSMSRAGEAEFAGI